jgi:Domain of unknown function (DUF5642)
VFALVHVAHRAALLSTVVCIAVAGCGSAGNHQKSSAGPVHGHDILSLTKIKHDFPDGYVVEESPQTTLAKEQADGVGNAITFDAPVTVDPPQCMPVLKPIHLPGDTKSVVVRASGPQGQISVSANQVLNPIAINKPPDGCDRVSYTMEDLQQRGTAERIVPPALDGGAAQAVKITVDRVNLADYFYVATLGDRLVIDLHARLDPKYDAVPVLSGLLTKAVNALRG